jgi:hypothetical protein
MIEPSLEPTNNIDENNIDAETKVSEVNHLSVENVQSEVSEGEIFDENTPTDLQSNTMENTENMTNINDLETSGAIDATSEISNNEEAELNINNHNIAEVKEELVENVELEVEEETTSAFIETAEVSQESTASNDIEEIEEIEEQAPLNSFNDDFTTFSKKDFVQLADKMLEAISARDISIADVKNIDNVIKNIKPSFEELIQLEKKEAKNAFIEQNGSEEGFEFKNDNHAIRFEGILIQIREKRHSFYQKLEREKEDYFEIKTRLLQELREIVETEEKGESKNNWEAFKNLQTKWKNAGNVNSVHNGTLWSAYNALVDRYFDIRSIQNELKDLDRKKNLLNKEGVVIKIEAIANSLSDAPLSNTVLKKANDLLQEYKQIGPGPREEQDLLWDRLKKAFDVIYEKKRELSQENASLLQEVFNAKNQLLVNLNAYLSFQSDSINEWNAKSKEVMEIQEQWNAIKGPLPREKGKDLSKEFWAALKQFFKNKSDFFAKLEAKREANYKAKEALCNEAQAILESGDHNAPNTNKIIELQKKWKTIGHVPEKYKDSLYNKFKATCDQYFDLKRNENKAQDQEFAQNLSQKVAILEEIEKLNQAGNGDLEKLSEFKKAFQAIGFVPRKDMQSIQDRYIKAVNGFVKSASGINKTEKDKLMLQNEVEVVLKSAGGSRNLEKQENEIRRKMKSLEDEISLTKNNMEFFGMSKNAEKLKEEYNKKVIKAEAELQELKDKLRLIVAAS